ncbi:MAG TPA: type IV secretion system protein [Caulobacteraceae bacterium]
MSCQIPADTGVIRGVLGAVDCNTRDFAQLGYEQVTASPTFQTALTALLTIYVAFVGYRLLFASQGARLSDAPGMALKIGAILALVTSWSVFQTLVFDLASGAPVEIAAMIAAGPQHASALAADPVGGLQVAYDQLSDAAIAFGQAGGAEATAYTSREAAAAHALSAASGALFMGSAGLISIATIAIGALTAVGPVFVALFLFLQTRGLFVGWVRALVTAAFASLSAWVLIVLMLAVLEPWLVALAQQRAEHILEVKTAVTTACIVFVFAASQAALLVAGAIVATGFKLNLSKRRVEAPEPAAKEQPAPERLASRAEHLAEQLRRDAASLGLGRSAATASAARAMRADPAVTPTVRIGDAGRRPSITREALAR